MSRYERESFLWPGVTLSLFSFGMFILGAAVESTTSDDRVHDIQPSNEQLLQQLAPAHSVAHLILNDEKHTFTFDTHDANGNPEACAGQYEQNEDFALVVGDLVCSQTEPAVPR